MMKLHDTTRAAALALAVLGAGLLAGAVETAVAQQVDATQAQAAAMPDITGSTVLLSSDVARLELDLASGETQAIELNDGQVLVNGEARGSYRPGGALERGWRDLLRSPDIDATDGLASLLAQWEPEGTNAGATDRTGLAAVLSALDRFDPAAAVADVAESESAANAGIPQATEQITIVPRAGSIDQLAERLRELNRTMGRIAGEEFELNGNFALVVHDDYRIADGQTIDGDVALLGGTLTVDGDIEGDVLVLGGDLLLEPGSLVMGDVRSMGGNVETTGATVTGEILALSAVERMAADAAERAAEVETRYDAEWDYDRRRDRGFFDSIFHNISHAIGDLIGTAIWLVMLTLMGALLVYFVPDRLDTITSEARGDVLRSFGVGLAGQLLFFPILLLLVVMIVTWLVIPFYLLAVAVAIPAGYVAAARGIGEAVVDRKYDLFERFDLNRQNTYYYVLNGFIVLLAPFALAAVLQLLGNWFGFLRGLSLFVGVVLTWAAATTGFGAIIITRGGGLVRDFRGFRKRRSVPLDDLRTDIPDPGASSAHADDGSSEDVNADDAVEAEDDDA